MTKKEYEQLLRNARKEYPKLSQKAMTELRRIYKKAGELAAEAVRKSIVSGAADITTESWTEISRQLSAGADLIREELHLQIPATTSNGISLTSKINEDFIEDVIAANGITRITTAQIKSMYRAVNDKLIRSIATRFYGDGYTFSNRVWKASIDYQNQIKDVISAGLAQGRDPVKIAKDLQVYISDGKGALVARLQRSNRFGELQRPTKEFMKRIGNKVDWRALRLVRSELYASIQQASLEHGRMNPAASGLYEWVMTAERQHWKCACPDHARNGPYKHEEVPGYPHSNCRCDIRPILRDTRQFQEDIIKWSNGESIDYIDKWYYDIYLTAA